MMLRVPLVFYSNSGMVTGEQGTLILLTDAKHRGTHSGTYRRMRWLLHGLSTACPKEKLRYTLLTDSSAGKVVPRAI
jgi:hypothetical protein